MGLLNSPGVATKSIAPFWVFVRVGFVRVGMWGGMFFYDRENGRGGGKNLAGCIGAWLSLRFSSLPFSLGLNSRAIFWTSIVSHVFWTSILLHLSGPRFFAADV